MTATPRRRAPLAVRNAGAFVLAVLALASSLGPGVAAAASKANGVTWSIQHGAKTITADMRITITPTCATPHFQPAKFGEARASWCEVDQKIADAIKANIEAIWNGHKYYCYDIIVNVNIEIDENPAGPDPNKRVKVRIDKTGGAISRVISRKTAGDWSSNDPSDAVQPYNNGAASSIWVYPPGADEGPNLYAHEAGHILGLHDTYETYVDPVDGKTKFRTIAGAPDDLMSDQKNSNIHDSTLRRMVERAAFSKTDLKCNYKIDQASFGGRITGQKCDPLGGQWVAQGTYSYAGAIGQQEWIMTMNEVTLRGNFVYSDYQEAEFAVGVKVYTDGAAAGQVTLTIDDELKARFHLVEQVHTYTSTTSKGGKGQDQNAPLASIDLVWEPIGKCPPP